MLDRIQPFRLKFIQKASPKERDAFDFSLIYKFYTDRTELCQRLKYIKWDDKLYILPNRRRAYENILSKIEGRKDVSDIKFTIKNAEERYEKWSLSNAEADL